MRGNKKANLSKKSYSTHEPTCINPKYMKNLIHELKSIINEIKYLKKSLKPDWNTAKNLLGIMKKLP